MAETERTFAQLQTLLADNETEDISEQDLRDMMVSALGGYASLYVDGGVAGQALVAAVAKLTAFAAVGPERGAAASHADDQITIGVAGNYEVTLTASLTAAVTTVLDVQLFVDTVAEAGFSSRVTADVASVDIGFSGIVALDAGAVLELRAGVVPDTTVTIRHAHLSVKRVG